MATDKTFFPAHSREVVRKMDINFKLQPWIEAEADLFRKGCTEIKDAYIFVAQLVHLDDIEAVDNSIEEFAARLSELYRNSYEELKMIGVLRYGTRETHRKYLALCINWSGCVTKDEIMDTLTRAFYNRCPVLTTTIESTPLKFAETYIKVATDNADYNSLDCGLALLSYGIDVLKGS